METTERSEKLTQLIWQYLFDVTHGEYPTFRCDAEILETTSTSIVARWNEQFLPPYQMPGEDGLLPGLTIPECLWFEEKTIKLEWPTEEGCASLSDDYLLTFIHEELDVEENVPWDDPRISDGTIAAAMTHFDEHTQADLLLDYFGSAKDIRYKLYPKRLRLPIRRFAVIASRAEARARPIARPK